MSYLSSPSHITGALELFDDEETRAHRDGTGREQQQHGPTDAAGPVILTRRGQMILLSLFGFLWAYPYLPVPAASSYLPSSIVTLWKATPPALVATGIATIWAGQQQQHLQYAPARPCAHSTMSVESDLELVLAQLGPTINSFLRALNSYDEIVERCFQALDSLEAALGRSTDGKAPQKADDGLPALPVREALLASLVSVEIAMKVALDSVASEERRSQGTRESPPLATTVVNREEMERLVEMYALQLPEGSARNTATSPHSESGPISPRRLRRPVSFYQPRYHESQVQHSSQQRESMPPMHRINPHEGDIHAIAPTPPRQRVSPQLAYLYGAEGQTDESHRTVDSPVRRDTRRASWTGYSPGLAAGSLLQHQSPARPAMNTSPISPAYATFSPSSPNSPGSLKKQKNRRRQSDQLPSSPNTWAQQHARMAERAVFAIAHRHSSSGAASSPMRGSLSSDSPVSQSVRLSASFRAVMDSPSRPPGISSALLAAESLHADDEDVEHDPSVRDMERAKAMQRIQSTALGLPPSRSQQESRSRGAHRPLSMFELNLGSASPHPTSASLLSSSAPIGNSSFEERRWSAHPAQTASWSSLTWGAGLARPSMRTVRQRPSSLVIQRPSMGPVTGRAALASPPLQLLGASRDDLPDAGKLGLFALAARGTEEKRMRREMICYLLAVQYADTVPPAAAGQADEADKVRQARNEAVVRFLLAFRQAVMDLVKVLSNESSALSAALAAEFGPSAAAVLAPPLSPLPATPRRNSVRARRSSRSRTPARERGLQIDFPGQYPRSPLIEVDPATPPASLSPRQHALLDEREGKEYPFGSAESAAETINTATAASNFAPRDPLSSEERQADATLAAAAQSSQKALQAIAAKMYLERKDLQKHISAMQESGLDSHPSSSRLTELTQRHESMRQDLEVLLKDWNEGRAALRRLQEANLKREKQTEGAREQRAAEQDAGTVQTSAGSRTTPDLGDASDVSSSALGKRDSTSSTLSATSDGDTLRTPATSPRHQPMHPGRPQDPRSRNGNGKAAVDETDVTQLLLDQTNPRHLPPPGLQEQLYEAFASENVARVSQSSADAKLSREKRIALARQKRTRQDGADGELQSQPLSQLELVSELKDVMAVLR